MKAAVYRGKNRVRVQDVPEPAIRDERDAIVRIVLSSICGTDIHLLNGRIPGMVPGTVLGHEAVGVVLEVGPAVEGLSPDDRVVVLSTLGCGTCSFCSRGFFAHCERTPVGPATWFFGGPAAAGSLPGLQAERARVPFADVTCVKLPPELDDLAGLALSDIFPTGWFAAQRAQIQRGQSVVVLGAGPVGQMAVTSAHRKGAATIVVVDREPARLELASRYPEVRGVSLSGWTSPLKRARAALGTRHGADAVLDCVGVDAASPWGFHAPTKPLEYAAELVRPEGVVSVVGLYPEVVSAAPLGAFLEKNVRLVGGNCHHRSHVEEPLEHLLAEPDDGRRVFTHRATLDHMPEAYEAFVEKEDGMVKCVLEVAGAAAPSLPPLGRALARR